MENLAVWGWAPGVYVVSGLPSASRDSDSYFQIGKGPLQQYYRSRYVADLRAHPPDVFIDAVAPGAFLWPTWTARDGYESVPELRSFVQQNYALADGLTLQPGTWPVRIFVRRDLQ